MTLRVGFEDLWEMAEKGSTNGIAGVSFLPKQAFISSENIIVPAF